MNWYNTLKFAMPIALLSCPRCKSEIVTDVKQKTTELGSSPYAQKEQKQRCITRCPKCRQFMMVLYDIDYTKNAFYPVTAITNPISPEQARDEWSKDVFIVTSVLSDSEPLTSQPMPSTVEESLATSV